MAEPQKAEQNENKKRRRRKKSEVASPHPLQSEMDNFQNNLQMIRVELGLSIVEASKLLCISRQTLVNLEEGRVDITFLQYCAIKLIYGEFQKTFDRRFVFRSDRTLQDSMFYMTHSTLLRDYGGDDNCTGLMDYTPQIILQKALSLDNIRRYIIKSYKNTVQKIKDSVGHAMHFATDENYITISTVLFSQENNKKKVSINKTIVKKIRS